MTRALSNAQPEKTQPTENSVLFALNELKALENDRVAKERQAQLDRRHAEEEQRRAEEAAALDRARREAEAAKLEAEDRERAARARATAELERDARMAAMRTELKRIEDERAQLHAELRSRASAPDRRPGYGLAFGLSSLVAASLAGLLVYQAQRNVPDAAMPIAAISTPASVETSAETTVAAPEAIVAAPLGIEADHVEAASPPAARPATERCRGRRCGRTHVVDSDSRETATDRDGLDGALDFGDEDGVLPSEAHRSR